MAAKKLAAFRALTIRDRTRVFGYLRRGEAPERPALAEATVEYGESILRSRFSRVFTRAFMLLLLAGSAFYAARNAFDGRIAATVFNASMSVAFVAFLARSPIFWPRRVRESLAATRG
jgi:hypothetical protein